MLANIVQTYRLGVGVPTTPKLFASMSAQICPTAHQLFPSRSDQSVRQRTEPAGLGVALGTTLRGSVWGWGWRVGKLTHRTGGAGGGSLLLPGLFAANSLFVRRQKNLFSSLFLCLFAAKRTCLLLCFFVCSPPLGWVVALLT